MTLYFAYGSNMSRALMRRHCPAAKEIGTALLAGYRFVITVDGYASIVPQPGETAHGVVWRLTPRDLAALNTYESLDSGLYRQVTLPIFAAGRRIAALVYIARPRGEGRPKPGYLDLVIAAARDWGLPDDYVRTLERWGPDGFKGERARESGEIG
jgi:gamma-glutamylcyclotransferase (GGCT)/AIG2-like uncharacterized protein YtfP